ncbi:hypothetical protein RGCCGE502_34336 (plasmid) [Rhizobium grahamii CCGE 502]|uniref:Uncharacterized protein n=1 Tax=Rhizobium grahamii CCGE 502 TaxID=990285 RepID=S3HKF0_9HYPH|nr:hypothetical protein RGCCGE502_34336 [Rhizobium grahamii CCGE 502]
MRGHAALLEVNVEAVPIPFDFPAPIVAARRPGQQFCECRFDMIWHGIGQELRLRQVALPDRAALNRGAVIT